MDYLAKLKDIDEQIKALQMEHGDLRREYVIAECPVKIGDIVNVNGYSHNGKEISVTFVWVKNDYGKYRFKARGSVIKKDGSIGSQTGEWSSDVLNEN